METKITSQTDTQATFTVTLTELELKGVVAHVYDELRGRVKVAGFRPGKAPDAIVDRELGSATVQGEVIEHAVESSYSQAVRQLALAVIAPPQVTLEKFVPYTELQYKAVVDLMPKVKLAKYQDFRIKRPTPQVDLAEVDRTIEDLRRREAARLKVERPVQTGDEVVLDFDGSQNGQPVRGASATNHTLLIGSGQFIPGFEEQLVGLKPGGEKSFDIRFPKDYHEPSLAGQMVTFKVKLHEVTELAKPDLDAEFVAKVSPFKTVDELKDDILQQVTSREAEAVSRQYEQQVLDKLLKDSQYKVPEPLLQQQLQRLRAELEQNLAYSGLDLPKYLELSKKTSDELDADMKPEAERRVGLAMVLTAVAEAEKLELAPGELDAEIDRLKARYNDEATRAELDGPNAREEVYNHLMASRVIAKLLSYAEKK